MQLLHLSWEGDTPLPHPPPARALRALGWRRFAPSYFRFWFFYSQKLAGYGYVTLAFGPIQGSDFLWKMWQYLWHRRTIFFAETAMFDHTPAEIWFGPRIFAPLNCLKNLTAIVLDNFHGGDSPSYDFFFIVIDGQNANPYRHCLTLWRFDFFLFELCLCCIMMFRRVNYKQPGIQKFWHLWCYYQDIYDWISPLKIS